MSIWNDVSGLFNGDIFYPDNPKRAERLKQLNNECGQFVSDVKMLANEMTQIMNKINENLRSCCPQLSPIAISKQQTSIFEKIPFAELSEVFYPLLNVPAISFALITAQVILESKDGSTLSAALTATLGIGAMWVSGGLLFGIMPFSLIGLGALQGASKRNELRKLIGQAAASRLKLYKSLYVNKAICDSLSGAFEAMKVLMEVYENSGINMRDAIEEQFKNAVKHLKRTCDVSDEEIKEMVSARDKSMNSWTNEG